MGFVDCCEVDVNSCCEGHTLKRSKPKGKKHNKTPKSRVGMVLDLGH